VAELAPGQETDEDPELYGARKAACEQIVEESFGDAALVVRPGLIVGPHDPTGRFTYWPHRVARGGEVLAPGSPEDPVQLIDVRDLADWIVSAAAKGVGGTFNATGEPMRFDDLLDECRAVSESDATFTWVPSERLLAEEVGPWMELPLWLPLAEYAGIQQASVERARAEGLTYRPLADTIKATLAEAEPVDGVGLTPERERQLLATSG
jgi:nucleoside-diphosphate-sugar epimerase